MMMTPSTVLSILLVALFSLSAEGTYTQSIALGHRHSCALLDTSALLSGAVKCWGSNLYGQLGDGTTTNRATLVDVSGITTAKRIALGGSHSCAVLTNGKVKCWGFNTIGQLGDGTTTDRTTPVEVSGITTAASIALGGYHSCALLTDWTVKCWGSNGNGELGDGTAADSLNNWPERFTPYDVSGITTAQSIALGRTHSCALLLGGTVKCWGSNSYGQLGDGTTTRVGSGRSSPVEVSGITTATSIALGGSHSCAVLTDSTVKCWGYNYNGQLGDGTTTDRTTPVEVSGITTAANAAVFANRAAASISLGNSHSCALLTGGAVKCWGSNNQGQLGDGTTTQRTTPVEVLVITDRYVLSTTSATSIALGSDHSCALIADLTTKCWGLNDYGQLGDGTTARRTTPVETPPPHGSSASRYSVLTALVVTIIIQVQSIFT